MEKGLTEKRNAVTDAGEELEHLVYKKTSNHMTVFEDIARCVDVGFNGPEAIQWSRLLYLPFPPMQEKDVSSNVKTWVQLSDLEVAIDEQIAKISQIDIKKCPLQSCNISFIDEWSHRWEFHPDSSNHHLTWHPEPFAFQKAAGTTMSLNKGSGLRDMNAKDKKKIETCR